MVLGRNQDRTDAAFTRSRVGRVRQQSDASDCRDVPYDAAFLVRRPIARLIRRWMVNFGGLCHLVSHWGVALIITRLCGLMRVKLQRIAALG